jgi:hypothetical protein
VNIVYAKSTTSITNDAGLSFTLHRGEVWSADDPLVKSRPHFFSDVPVVARVSQDQGFVEVIEQATAAPGERRKTR